MNDQITVSETALKYLRSTSPWAMFLAVMGFIATAFMVLASLFMFAVGALAPANSKLPASVFTAIGVLYLVLSIFFCLFPSILLIRYSSAISRIPVSGQAALEEALARQKTFWTYVGIFTIVMLVLEAIILIGEYKFGLFHGLRPYP